MDVGQWAGKAQRTEYADKATLISFIAYWLKVAATDEILYPKNMPEDAWQDAFEWFCLQQD